jgi:hypothetical protein
MLKLYLIGSLRNSAIPTYANELRQIGFDVFDDWYAAGPDADDCWRDYELARGHTYVQALQGLAAQHVFSFDRKHLDGCDLAVLCLPAGKSAHIELGYIIGQGKPGYIILDNPDRFDVMYKFASGVFYTLDELKEHLYDEVSVDNSKCRVYNSTLCSCVQPRESRESTEQTVSVLHKELALEYLRDGEYVR